MFCQGAAVQALTGPHGESFTWGMTDIWSWGSEKIFGYGGAERRHPSLSCVTKLDVPGEKWNTVSLSVSLSLFHHTRAESTNSSTVPWSFSCYVTASISPLTFSNSRCFLTHIYRLPFVSLLNHSVASFNWCFLQTYKKPMSFNVLFNILLFSSNISQ